MSAIIAIGIIVGLAVMILLSQKSSDNDNQTETYLTKLAKFLEGSLEPHPEMEGSHRINFRYEGQHFMFDDIEEKVFDSIQHRGYLKLPTHWDITLSFTEKPRGSITVSLDPMHEISSGWVRQGNKISVPKQLVEFDAYSNKKTKAEEILKDEEFVQWLVQFKGRNKRGRPIMALDIIEGVLVLKFSPRPDIKPALIDLQHNATVIDKYLDMLIPIAEKLNDYADIERKAKEREDESHG